MAATSSRLNCWEYSSCGRGPDAVAPYEPCIVARETLLDGINGGLNGGRSCWAVAGTLGVDDPGGRVPRACNSCEFRRDVFLSETPEFTDCFEILERLGYADPLNLTLREEQQLECPLPCSSRSETDG